MRMEVHRSSVQQPLHHVVRFSDCFEEESTEEFKVVTGGQEFATSGLKCLLQGWHDYRWHDCRTHRCLIDEMRALAYVATKRLTSSQIQAKHCGVVFFFVHKKSYVCAKQYSSKGSKSEKAERK